LHFVTWRFRQVTKYVEHENNAAEVTGLFMGFTKGDG